jgi:hypothetical protein
LAGWVEFGGGAADFLPHPVIATVKTIEAASKCIRVIAISLPSL